MQKHHKCFTSPAHSLRFISRIYGFYGNNVSPCSSAEERRKEREVRKEGWVNLNVAWLSKITRMVYLSALFF